MTSQAFSVGSLAYKSQSNGYILDLMVDQRETDPAGNRSLVAWQLRLRSGPNNRFNGQLPCRVTLDGTVVGEETLEILARYDHTYTLLEGESWVDHALDGTCRVEVMGHIGAIANPYAPPALECGGAVELEAIARACTLSATDTYIGSTAVIFVDRKSAEYCYTLEVDFNNLVFYLDAAGAPSETPVLLTAAQVPFPVPESFYDRIPNASWGLCVLTCETFLGDSFIGRNLGSFRAEVYEPLGKPQVSATIRDINPASLEFTGGDAEFLVRYISTARVDTEVRCCRGATIQQILVNGQAGNPVEIPNIETDMVTVTAVDSRGFSTTLLLRPPMLDYVPLTVHATALRTDPVSGRARLKVWGNAFLLPTVICEIGDGIKKVCIPESLNDHTYEVELELEDMDYTQSHSITVYVYDELVMVQHQVTLPKGLPVFEWGEEDFVFHVPVTAPNISELAGRVQELEEKLREAGL